MPLHSHGYFNSIKVRLEPGRLPFARIYLIFQFHKGAIRTISKISFSKSILNFNSIKVRLELGAVVGGVVVRGDFNSIKVRLELHRSGEGSERQTFQFHKGAIRTDIERQNCLIFSDFNSIKVRLELAYLVVAIAQLLRFQFHKGAIRTEILHNLIGIDTYFNSIKVRLELSDDLGDKAVSQIFQFHKGAIRTFVLHR